MRVRYSGDGNPEAKFHAPLGQKNPTLVPMLTMDQDLRDARASGAARREDKYFGVLEGGQAVSVLSPGRTALVGRGEEESETHPLRVVNTLVDPQHVRTHVGLQHVTERTANKDVLLGCRRCRVVSLAYQQILRFELVGGRPGVHTLPIRVRDDHGFDCS